MYNININYFSRVYDFKIKKKFKGYILENKYIIKIYSKIKNKNKIYIYTQLKIKSFYFLFYFILFYFILFYFYFFKKKYEILY